MDSVVESFQDAIRSAATSHGSLRVRGGGSKDFYGGPLNGVVLDTGRYAGVVDHDPGELVLTARCGTLLTEIEHILKSHGQQLPFDPPHFGSGATLGGAVASGLCGPLRFSSGPVRDHVLGVNMMDGRGDVLRFGGRVIKNVAGYDVSRLLAGSLGTLGLMLDVTVKVNPMPIADATVCFEMGQQQAVDQLNVWLGKPCPLVASAWLDNVLFVRWAGARAAVAAARSWGGEILDAVVAESWWRDLREQRLPFFTDRSDLATLWRITVPSTAPSIIASTPQLIEWGGSQRWLYGDVDGTALRELVSSLGGHATAFRNGDRRKGVFTAVTPELQKIQARLKEAFDPHKVFNPGRLLADL